MRLQHDNVPEYLAIFVVIWFEVFVNFVHPNLINIVVMINTIAIDK
jgi:hypothetical protein